MKKTRRVVLPKGDLEFLAVVIHGGAYDFIAHTNIEGSGGGAAFFYPHEHEAARNLAAGYLGQFETAIVRLTLRVSEPSRGRKK